MRGQLARMAHTSRRRNALASLPLGRRAGRSMGRDKAARRVEYHHRLKPVVVVMGVEQAQLLAAMDRIEGVVDVERDPLGNPRVDEPGGRRNRDRPWRGPCAKARAPGRFSSREIVDWEQSWRSDGVIHRHLEQRIVAQARGVGAVLVAGGDHQQSKTNDAGKTVRDLIRRAQVHQAGGQPVGHPETLLRPPQRHNAAVRRQQPPIEFGHHRLAVHR